MCGRYASSASAEDLIDEFDIDEDRLDDATRSLLVNPQDPPVGEPDFNVAPTKQTPVVLTRRPRGDSDGDPTRQLRLLTWGLVPPWSKDVKIGTRMINARSEDILASRAYAKAATSRRCLVPADGWYEWQASPTAVDAKGKPRKQPFYVRRADGDPIAFAGVYEFWKDRSKDPDDPLAWLASYAIITTAAEPGLDRIHDRQPMVLDRGDWQAWLDPEQKDPDVVERLLQGAPPGRFEAWPVSRAVSSNRNNGPALVDPVGQEELDGVVDPMTGEVIGAR
ncbi:SOS response-associated peptidase [Luteipulveratus sp. YIM 133132]|uniref:SOS response-associated peptidase n=1 Tax=Luteipulveratus flavus TaxID=3031728 RepID=UPI0023AE808B|nr:SOS response-associated peptidase [Luteipulveratus sp. YIM 133132]MDE9365879.1 SOS response-associated peptidase [Luteipulveratus sp. YIM 133132]